MPEQNLYNLAVALHRKGRLAEAANLYQKALIERPAWPDALFNMAQCLKSQSNFDGAVKYYRQLLAADPDHAKGAFCLGSLLLIKGENENAIQWLQHAKVINPRWAELENNLGKAYLAKGEFEKARSCFEQAARLSPDLAEAWFNLAELDSRKAKTTAAIEKYQKAIALDPGMLPAHNNMGNMLKNSKRYTEAITAFEQVLALDPKLAEGHYNLGSVYRLMERHDAAILHFSKAIQLRPDYAEAWNNLALTCKNIGDFDRAGKYFNRALQIEPKLAVARWNRALLNLLKGNWQSGWQDFEHRFNLSHWRTIYPHRIHGRRWDGRTIPNQTLFVHDEQGLGDTFQFVRYLPWAKSMCGRLVFETRPEIIPLLENTLGIDQIVERTSNGPSKVSFDHYIPLMSIPWLMKLKPQQMGEWAPYIRASENKTARWKSLLPPGPLKIGLVWAGRPEHGNDAIRSCGFEALSPLLKHKAVQFIALQKGAAERQLDAYPYPNITRLGTRLEDFSDTAAVLAQLDLLITVDTSVAHLAGAMGKPAWIMIPYIPDWRWGIEGKHTRWYPTITLFRQPRPKDWASVTASMEQELRHLKRTEP